MNRKVLGLVTLVVSIALCQITFADNHSTKSSMQASCPCKNKFFKKLDLTPEQQTQIKAIKEQANVQRAVKQKEIVAIDNQIQELTRAEQLDEAKLDMLLNQKKEIMASLIKNKIIVKHQVYNILTAQQKDKYNEMIKEWEKKRLQKLNNVHDAITQ